jgi:F0F1-type ATP synthase membrane subunit c/vacuolar-type H+-ATPase subunit K
LCRLNGRKRLLYILAAVAVAVCIAVAIGVGVGVGNAGSDEPTSEVSVF